jgi:hypothetical protein
MITLRLIRSFAKSARPAGLRASLEGAQIPEKSKKWTPKDTPKKKLIEIDPNEGKKLFENVEFDEDGKYLLMHHYSARKYYKMNVAFVAMFLAMSYWNYKKNEAVFWNDKFAKVYLGIIGSGLIGLYLFANR